MYYDPNGAPRGGDDQNMYHQRVGEEKRQRPAPREDMYHQRVGEDAHRDFASRMERMRDTAARELRYSGRGVYDDVRPAEQESAYSTPYAMDPYQSKSGGYGYAPQDSRGMTDDADYGYGQPDAGSDVDVYTQGFVGEDLGPSRDFGPTLPPSKIRTWISSVVIVAVVAAGAAVVSRIQSAGKDTAVVNTEPVVVSEAIPSEAPVVPVEAAKLLALNLNTTSPVFGSARLMIDYEVDADAYVRVEILNADGSVFAVVDEARPVTKGKIRTYFDGTDAAGEWITLGAYQVRASILFNEEQARAEAEAGTDAAAAQTEAAQNEAAQTEAEPSAIDWEIKDTMTADFTVDKAPYRTPNSRPAMIATPTPSIDPSPSVSPSTEPTDPGTDPGTDIPGTDTPGTDTPGTDTPGTDTPGTDTPGTDTPGTDTPGTDTPGTDTPASESNGAAT